jgi:quercetin dioxygenase-like cupin family protein
MSNPDFTTMGIAMFVRVSAEDSGGAISVIEQHVPPGKGSPPHTVREDKTFYILQGAFTLARDGETIAARVGDAVFIPRGAVHNFTNSGGEEGRLIAILTPGGHERFLRAMAEAGPTLREHPEQLKAIAAEHGVEIKM